MLFFLIFLAASAGLHAENVLEESIPLGPLDQLNRLAQEQQDVSIEQVVELLTKDFDQTVEQTAAARVIFEISRNRNTLTEKTAEVWKKAVTFFINILQFNNTDDTKQPDLEARINALAEEFKEIHSLLKENKAIHGNVGIFFIKDESLADDDDEELLVENDSDDTADLNKNESSQEEENNKDNE